MSRVVRPAVRPPSRRAFRTAWVALAAVVLAGVTACGSGGDRSGDRPAPVTGPPR